MLRNCGIQHVGKELPSNTACSNCQFSLSTTSRRLCCVKPLHSCPTQSHFGPCFPTLITSQHIPFSLSGCYVLLISSEIVRKMLLIEIHFFCEFALESRWWSFAHSDEGLTAQVALRTVCQCLLGVDMGWAVVIMENVSGVWIVPVSAWELSCPPSETRKLRPRYVQ